MDKREEIREVIAGILCPEDCENWDDCPYEPNYCPMVYRGADKILTYLDSQGVVIKIGGSEDMAITERLIEE